VRLIYLLPGAWLSRELLALLLLVHAKEIWFVALFLASFACYS
jgi:hypothetical protein